MKFPVLQSFEKDLNKIVFVINQLSRGLDDLAITVGLRETLTGNRTYNVAPAPTGSDTNDGLAAPFATIQKALDVVVGSLDLAGNDVVIQLANGTYTGGARVLETHVGGGRIIIRGNTGSPSSVIWSVTGNHCLYVESITAIQVEYLRLRTTTSGHCLMAAASGKITLGTGLDFNTCPGYHLLADLGGIIIMHDPNSYTISGGGGQGHFGCSNGHMKVAGIAITISAATTFTGGFAVCDVVGQMTINANTYTGAGLVTGPKYQVTNNAVVMTFGGVLPGSVPGTAMFGGLYI